MFGMATNRAEAQVVRLSVLYAALDRSPLIRAEHLLAALAVWRYCEQSARWAFGDATGDPTADTILSALRRGGELDRQNIYELLGRHVNRSTDRCGTRAAARSTGWSTCGVNRLAGVPGRCGVPSDAPPDPLEAARAVLARLRQSAAQDRVVSVVSVESPAEEDLQPSS